MSPQKQRTINPKDLYVIWFRTQHLLVFQLERFTHIPQIAPLTHTISSIQKHNNLVIHPSIVLFLNLVHRTFSSEVSGTLPLFFIGCCKGKKSLISCLSSPLRKHMLTRMKMKAGRPTTACSYTIMREWGLLWAPLAAAAGLWMT